MLLELYALPLLAVAAIVVPWLAWRRSSPARARSPFGWASAVIVSLAAGYGALWTATRARSLLHGPFWFWLLVAVAVVAQIAAHRIARGEGPVAAPVFDGAQLRASYDGAATARRRLFGVLVAAVAALLALDLAAIAVGLIDRGGSWLPAAPTAALNALPYLAAWKGLTLLLLAGALAASVYVMHARGRGAVVLASGLGVVLGAIQGPALLWRVVPAPGGVTLWLHAAGAFVGLVAALTLHASGGLIAAPDHPPASQPQEGTKEPLVVRNARRDLAIAAAVLVGTAALIGWRPMPSGFAWPLRWLALAWAAVFPAAIFLARGARRISTLELQFARVLAWVVAALTAFALVWPAQSVPFIGARQLFYFAPIVALLLLAALITHACAARSIARASLFFSPYARSRGLGLGLSYVVLYVVMLHPPFARLLARGWLLLQ